MVVIPTSEFILIAMTAFKAVSESSRAGIPKSAVILGFSSRKMQACAVKIRSHHN